ncbi:MAG TPA: polyribonucleotide nucleotidyltransferase [Microscillaceae bacterium]|nr:polyribonucleotide nucleotidyltransferase [Microscillaceae bacterium]
MLPQIHTISFNLPDGREVQIETGKLARQADGAVVVKMGNTMLLATVVSSKEIKDSIDFFPLSVDYQEKFASAGKIPGSFMKREGKLSDYEVLISRLVDRVLRPLFPDGYYAETQVNIFLISADSETPPDCLAALAASSALAVSNIPFEGPISEVRVARVNGQFVINPTVSELAKSDIDLMVGATYENILMVEGELKEVAEADMVAALKVAHEAVKAQCLIQQELRKMVGAQNREWQKAPDDEALQTRMRSELYDKLYACAASQIVNKNERSQAFKAIKEGFVATLEAEAVAQGQEPISVINKTLLSTYFHKLQKEACRQFVLNERKRIDGRQLNEIRPIWGEANYLPSAHGSALFTRGETQSLTTVTLGTKLDEQIVDTALQSGYNKFLLHYNFPAFSTGEIKPNRAPGRREVGHGNLAYRALKNMLPRDEENPYTIRIVSDILESNGSSSMATVCAGSMALMDAGLKIQSPVSGIAMGLITDENTKAYAILSDILGDEDHLGDMDFKVTGTSKGITACQMDLKINGLPYQVLEEALEQARQGRLYILDKMLSIIPSISEDLKPHAPRSVIVKIERDQIGAVIGPGGKVVQDIQKTTGTTVVIEEKDNAGFVNIFATDKTAMDAALARVKAIVALPVIGDVYDGKVKNITNFGAFIEFLPGKEGLLHISDIKWERVEKMEDVLEVGEEVKVKLVDIDKKTGKFRLSRKVLLPKPQ